MDKSHHQVVKENEELQDLCYFLDDGRQKAKLAAYQWKSFGKYTAAVLKNEVDCFERKLAVLQEKLERLSKENAELRDICLFMNQSGGKTPLSEHKSESKNSSYAVHSACVVEVNKEVGELPQFHGLTMHTNDTEGPQAYEKRKAKQTDDSASNYLSQLEERLERLETEKLQLVKSLSGTHMDINDPNISQPDDSSSLPNEEDLDPPPDIHAFLQFIKTGNQQDNKQTVEEIKDKEQPQIDISTSDILKLVTLIDVSKRLDAMPKNPPLEPIQEAEVAVLRALIDAVWKQIKLKHVSVKENGKQRPTSTLSNQPQGILPKSFARDDRTSNSAPLYINPSPKVAVNQPKKYSAKVLRTEL